MLFTGINYRSIPSTKSATVNFDSIKILYSGDKYDGSLPSGAHFGFSGDSNNISFQLKSGKVYDPENRVVYGYSENTKFSMELSFDETKYKYSFEGSDYCVDGNKSDFSVNKFFFNSNGLNCDVNFNIFGPVIDYSISFPSSYNSSNLVGTFTNNSSSVLKIFSAQITQGNASYFDLSAINNLSVSANSSVNLTIVDLINEITSTNVFTLSLFTNFGTIDYIVTSYRI